jgi:hypothetical protein
VAVARYMYLVERVPTRNRGKIIEECIQNRRFSSSA